MQIDPDKFEVMTDTKSRIPIKYNYSLHGQTLKQEISVKYIGVEIDEHVRCGNRKAITAKVYKKSAFVDDACTMYK